MIREFYLCPFCRHHKQKCEDVPGKFQCRNCIDKNRPCGLRQRKYSKPGTLEARDEYLTTLMACAILLSAVRHHCSELSMRLYPFPCFRFLHNGAFGRSRSLGVILEVLAVRMQVQIGFLNQAIDRLHFTHISLWNNTNVSDLHRTVSFHPSRAMEPASSMNAGSIAACVQFVTQSSGFHYLQPLLPIEVRIQCYQKAAFNVRNLLEQSFFGLAHNDQPLVLFQRAVPASIIAYLNGDGQAAFELWKQTPAFSDLLGRTLGHVVVERGDIGFLQQMQAWDVRLIDCGPDARGLTLLALAICTGSDNCFDLVLDIHRRIQWSLYQRYFVPEGLDFRWLDLALASGSLHIVTEVERIGYTSPPYQNDMKVVIQMGRADLTAPFLDWLFYKCHSSETEVRKLLKLAGKQEISLREERDAAREQGRDSQAANLDGRLQDMKKLVFRLRVRQVRVGTREDTIGSLQMLTPW